MGLFSRKSKLEEAEEARQKDLETQAFNRSFAEESIRQASKRGRIAAATGKREVRGAKGVLGKMQDIGRHIGPGPALGGSSAKIGGWEIGFPDDILYGKKKKD